MKTKDYQKLVKNNKKFMTTINNLKKQLTIACEVIDELRTERDRKETLISKENRARWTDYDYL
jgi:hypothetical protein